MSDYERYWMNCVIYMLLSRTFDLDTWYSLAASISCYLLCAGYFVAMMRTVFSKAKG